MYETESWRLTETMDGNFRDLVLPTYAENFVGWQSPKPRVLKQLNRNNHTYHKKKETYNISDIFYVIQNIKML